MIERDIERVLISADDLRRRTEALAREVTATFLGRPLTVVVVGNGAIFFAADLLRLVPLPLELETVSVSSYVGSESSGKVTLHAPPRAEVTGRDVLIVEDILDTGRTLATLRTVLEERGAARVAICVLLDKTHRRVVPVEPEFVGFQVPDEFVVGYGMDFEQRYRNLPFIGVLKAGARGQRTSTPSEEEA